jgi:hypothetical protein
MSGGIVSGNNASGYGGGVFVSGNFVMIDSAVVDATNPVYLRSNYTITAGGPLSPPGDIAAVIESGEYGCGDYGRYGRRHSRVYPDLGGCAKIPLP